VIRSAARKVRGAALLALLLATGCGRVEYALGASSGGTGDGATGDGATGDGATAPDAAGDAGAIDGGSSSPDASREDDGGGLVDAGDGGAIDAAGPSDAGPLDAGPARDGGGGVVTVTDLAIDSTGRAFVVGNFVGEIALGSDVATSTGRQSGYVAAIDPGGAPAWLHTVASDDLVELRDIAVGASGTTFTTGHVEGIASFDGNTHPATTLQDVLVLARDRAGALLWWHAYGADFNFQSSDIAFDPIRDRVIVGGLYLAFGVDPDFDGVVMPRSTNDQAFVVATSAAGTMQWGARPESGGEASVGGVAIVGDRICVAGRFSSDLDFDDRSPPELRAAGAYDAFVAGMAADGSFSWWRSLGGAAYDVGVGVAAVGDDCVVLARTDSAAAFGTGPLTVARFGPGSPGAIWTSAYGGDTTLIPSAILAEAGGGGVLVLGSFTQPSWTPTPGRTVTSAGGRDIFLARHDASGAMVSLRSFGSAADDPAGGLALAPGGVPMIAAALGAPAAIPGAVLTIRGGTDVALITLAP
jgi:hypothetical protein